tara:strand:+ start:784 stop:1011 length:228 start_codon:yes stop_codon:yes gene_type:complete
MQKMDFIHKCPLSHEDDKTCVFAVPVKDTVHCKQIFGWWDNLDVRLHDRCFGKLRSRDKLLWRNRQIKKTLPGKI